MLAPVARPHVQVKDTRRGIAKFCRKCSGQKIGIRQEVIVHHAYRSASGSQRPKMVRIGYFNPFQSPEHPDRRVSANNNIIS